MATKECTSGYAVWVQMKKEDENVMVYKNIGRRVLLLQEGGFIEEVKLEGVENLHGRKDYKLTMKGLEELIPYLSKHPKEIGNVVIYMDKFNLDTEKFSHLLFTIFDSIRTLTSIYENLTTAKSSRELQYVQGKDIIISEENTFGIFDKKRIKALAKDLLNQMKAGTMEYDPDTLTLVRTEKGRRFVSVPIIKLTPSLLAAMELWPTVPQMDWEDAEDFKFKERIRSEISHSKKKKPT